jgi:hypothetical protein
MAVLGAVVSLAASGLVTAPAQAAVGSCTTWVSSGTAQAYCNISSGQFRVRADCTLAPDLYSPWRGVGNWHLYTGKCPWGIRGAIMESRY